MQKCLIWGLTYNILSTSNCLLVVSEYSENSFSTQYIYNYVMYVFVCKGNIHEMKVWPQMLTKKIWKLNVLTKRQEQMFRI